MPTDGAHALCVEIVTAGSGLVRFGPLTPDPFGVEEPGDPYSFLLGPITVVAADGATYRLDGRSGIEPLALAHFRSDIRLLASGEGTVFFGDHDFGQIIELHGIDGGAHALANLASLNLFDVDLGFVTNQRLAAARLQIDRIEHEFGPLTGYCDACGIPQSAYYPE